MKFDLSFWRFIIYLNVAKTGLWSKGDDVFILHLGTFSDGRNTAVRFVVLPFSLMVGFARKEQE